MTNHIWGHQDVFLFRGDEALRIGGEEAPTDKHLGLARAQGDDTAVEKLGLALRGRGGKGEEPQKEGGKAGHV